MTDKKLYILLIIILLAISVWAAINPVHLVGWAIENVLVVWLAGMVAFTSKYLKFSNASYIVVTFFLVLHIIGSHYSYSEVPFGYTLGNWMNSTRNMYDRVVHLAFGLAFALPAYEMFTKAAKTTKPWALFAALMTIWSAAAFYEIIEWIWASSISAETGDVFVGAQGDFWDAQKDMALAMGGSLFTLLMVNFYKDR